MTDRAAGFLESCGSAGPLILGVDEPGASTPSWRVLDRPFALVGRSPGADLFLNDPAVSRRHAYLQLIGGRLFCIDLDSRTGTRWGDEAGVWGWLSPEAGVGIGPFAVRPRAEGVGGTRTALGLRGAAVPPLPTSRSFDQPGSAEMTLEIDGRTNGPGTWRVSRALTLIGSASGCRIRLDGGRVAGIHASLVRTPTGVFAVDLLARGGILLNGERVSCARLGPGDELTVGPHAIRVRPDLPQLEAGGRGPAGLPASLGAGEGAEALARALVEEFGRSHERAGDRLQETLVAVLESIAGMHREQMALIGAELARTRLLAETQAVRTRDDRQLAARPAALRLVSGGTTPGPAARPPVEHARRAAAGGRPVVPASPASPLRQPAGPPPSLADEAEFHARVFDRLAEASGEGQGRWRRLVESILRRDARSDTPDSSKT